MIPGWKFGNLQQGQKAWHFHCFRQLDRSLQEI
jgi:hypothetical protein